MRRILFILGKDVHNKPVYEIYKECVNRGFNSDIYATTLEDGHLNLFAEIKDKIKHINKLTEEQIDLYDYIFSAITIYNYKIFRNAHKYIFINSLNCFDSVYFSGDFVFTARDPSKSLIANEYLPIDNFNFKLSIPGMATGWACYKQSNITNDDKLKKILFIDSGHFPFGTKKELAEYVVKIADYCSDYELLIKPRYLPGDNDTTHKNSENLYEYLDNYEKLPPNLTLIREHTNLQDELKKVDLVICPEGTTSYVEVILANKEILIFTGFPNNEAVLWNKDRISVYNRIVGELPCRINYKDIFKYLPHGIKVNAKDLNNIIYKTDNVVEDIVDAMEYIYINFISKNIFPEMKYYKSESYLDEIKPDYNLTWEDIIRRRYRNTLYEYAALKVKSIPIEIDCSDVISYIDDIDASMLNEDNLDKINIDLDGKICDLYIQNSEKMMKNSNLQSLLCWAYFKKNRFNEFKPMELKCNAYYAYCMAKIKFDGGSYEESLNYINEYFDEVDNNAYEVSYADDKGVKVMAHYYKGAALFHMNNLREAKIHLDICDKAWGGKHKKATEYLKLIDENSN